MDHYQGKKLANMGSDRSSRPIANTAISRIRPDFRCSFTTGKAQNPLVPASKVQLKVPWLEPGKKAVSNVIVTFRRDADDLAPNP